MSDHDQSRQQPEPVGGFWKSRAGIALIAFLAIAGLLVLSENSIRPGFAL